MKSYKLRRNLTKTRHTVRSVAALNEGPWRWAVGIQAGIAIGVPVALFTLSGYPSFGLIASLGGFTVLYGVSRPPADRLKILPFVAIGLILSSILGVVCAFSEWLTAIYLIVLTVATSFISFGMRLGPPGPVMFILVAAISSRLAAPSSSGGASISGDLIPLLIMTGAILALLVVVASSVLPFMRDAPPAEPEPEPGWKIQLDKETLQIVIRVIAGVTVAILVSKPLGIQRAYWVVVAVCAILQAGQDRQLTTIRAIQRVLGTLLGVVVFQLLILLKPTGAWIILIIVLFQFATQVVIARNYVLGLIFITPIALMNTMAGRIGVLVPVRERILDTLLGAGIALVVFWIEELISRQSAVSSRQPPSGE